MASSRRLAQDLQCVWDAFLEILCGLHLPTFSLAATHSRLLIAGPTKIVIAVRRTNFWQMLNSKKEHLELSASILSGAPVNVYVEIVSSEVWRHLPVYAEAEAIPSEVLLTINKIRREARYPLLGTQDEQS